MQQLDSTSDFVLLAHYASGDEDAFAELVTRHAAHVRNVCTRVLGRAADADDAAQLTFLALARKAADFAPDVSVPAWLHRTALYLSLRLRHANQLRKTREAEVQPLATIPPNDEAADWQHTRTLLWQEIQALPKRYREPLVLHYGHGHSQNEVAAQLGCSYGTVSGRLNRARALLRERLLGRGIAVPMAMLVLLTPPLVSSREEDIEPQWHASVGVQRPPEFHESGLSQAVLHLGAHIYMPLCIVLTLCWCATLFR